MDTLRNMRLRFWKSFGIVMMKLNNVNIAMSRLGKKKENTTKQCALPISFLGSEQASPDRAGHLEEGLASKWAMAMTTFHYLFDDHFLLSSAYPRALIFVNSEILSLHESIVTEVTKKMKVTFAFRHVQMFTMNDNLRILYSNGYLEAGQRKVMFRFKGSHRDKGESVLQHATNAILQNN
ncbi:hypothetical protein ARMSODRAFT_980907 [Armillaria solidipes]|uniref:Uncharacterized protein n=1 Tax=Armillaria solidipes TaxID=1076256 RepID=A0A2H3AX63_9AGAR|nr:hypothetical protein ARMSODRAFT_980907 [Armillaria solidipes]